MCQLYATRQFAHPLHDALREEDRAILFFVCFVVIVDKVNNMQIHRVERLALQISEYVDEFVSGAMFERDLFMDEACGRAPEYFDIDGGESRKWRGQ